MGQNFGRKSTPPWGRLFFDRRGRRFCNRPVPPPAGREIPPRRGWGGYTRSLRASMCAIDLKIRSYNFFYFLSKFPIQRHSLFRSYQKSYLSLFSSLLVLHLGKSHLSVCSSHGDLKTHLYEFLSFRPQSWSLNATQLTFSVFARKKRFARFVL